MSCEDRRFHSHHSLRNFISVISKQFAEIVPMSVTQGKTWHNYEACCAATHAIDKDLSTGSATETVNEAGWLKLKFDSTYSVHKIIVHFWFYNNWYLANDGCVQNSAVWKQCVDDANNVDVSVYKGDAHQKSCGTLHFTYALDQADQIYTLVCDTEGDTVILSKDTGPVMAMYEVIVIRNTGMHAWTLPIRR